MQFIKKQSAGFYTSILVIILTIVCAALYSVNAATEYYSDTKSIVVVLSVIAVIACLASIIFGEFAEKSPILAKIADILAVAVPVLVLIAGMLFLSDRVYSYAIIYGSDLENGNEAAQSAAGQSLVAVILYIVTALLAVVSAFFAVRKENKAQ